MLGLSDAGAHASQLCDAVLRRPTCSATGCASKGVLTLEEAVRRLTSQPAEVFGIRDRGRLAPGLAADVTVFDPATVGCCAAAPRARLPGRRRPAGRRRDRHPRRRRERRRRSARTAATSSIPTARCPAACCEEDAPHERYPDHLRRLAHHRAAEQLHRLHRPAVPRPRAAHRAHRRRRRRLRDRRHEACRCRSGIVAAAGKPAEEIRLMGARFEELHRGGWDPEARIADQERDGVAAEVIYPTVGMAALQPPRLRLQEGLLRRATTAGSPSTARAHPDAPARRRARRRCARRRTASRTCEAIKALGLRGVMMPGQSRRRGLRLAGLRRLLGGGDRRSGCRSRSTSSPRATTRARRAARR